MTLLLGTTPSENTQIQHRNTPEDISDILGTRVYKRYVDTPLQTLDSIIVNQPKRFLPLAEEVKRIAKEIRIEKINEQWTGIPREQLLNQSFNDQLNSIQILEQLAPLQLAKEHLPGDIIDILERLGKADNILFNQLYYIAENCTDHYYNKVIETFVALLKCQFAYSQLLLVNTARSLIISRGLPRSPRTDLENLPETPNDSRQHSGPTFSHRQFQKWHRKGIRVPERGHS